jgi:rhodanese-related sulfurtransferase
MKNLLTPLLFAGLFATCNAQNNFQLDASSFSSGIEKPGIQLLDVRTAEEYKNGHIRNSLQANWNDNKEFKDRTAHLDKNRPVYVYCLAGARSAAAAKWLRAEGFNEVFELKTGMNGWRQAGLPVESNVNVASMTLAEYEKLVNSQPTVLVDFGASWCPPCKKMEPLLAELQKEAGSRFTLVKVDGGTDIEVMKALKVEALPCFLIYKNGQLTWRHQGIASKDELLGNL